MQNFEEFWTFYLTQHQNQTCRRLHFIGTFQAIGVLVYSIEAGSYRLILPAFALGYGFAWVGHFVFERNRPATFKYPLWSFLADLKMFLLMSTRQLKLPD